MISSMVLAAGMSTRMGEPKALLDWGGEPLICYQVKQLIEAGVDEVIVVLGYRGDEVHRAIKRLPCRVMLNPRFHTGRAGSLRIGAKAVNRDADAIVISNVDQPRPTSLIKELIAAHEARFAATRPSFDGHHGHPVVLSGWMRKELLEVTDDNDGLRGILRAHATEMHEIEADASLQVDLNTPGDYQQALRAFGLAS
jgi:CTP:molybdopterin cytidylyltransferase MocA